MGHHTGNDDYKDAKLEGNSRRNSSQETTVDNTSLLSFIRENEKTIEATEEAKMKVLQTKASFWRQRAYEMAEQLTKTQQQENAELKELHAELKHMKKENGDIEQLRKKIANLRKSIADLTANVRNFKRDLKLQDDREDDIVKLHSICTELSELIMIYEPAWLKGSSMAGQWEAFIKRNEEILKKVKDNILAELYEGCPWEDVVRRAMEH